MKPLAWLFIIAWLLGAAWITHTALNDEPAQNSITDPSDPDVICDPQTHTCRQRPDNTTKKEGIP